MMRNAIALTRAWLKARPRVRILVWAVLISTIAGVIDFGLPFDDALRSIRTEIRRQIWPQKPSGDIVVVSIDQATLDALGPYPFSANVETKLIENLFARGARRVFHTRPFDLSGISDNGDGKIFSDLSRKYPGRLFFLVTPKYEYSSSKDSVFYPIPEYFSGVKFVHSYSNVHPFGLAIEFNKFVKVRNEKIEFIGNILSNRNDINDRFIVDQIYKPSDFYTLKYEEKFTARKSFILNNKDVIIINNHPYYGNITNSGFFSRMPSAYYTIIAAENMKNGPQLKISWIYFFIFSFAVCLSFFKFGSNKIALMIFVSALILTITVPMILDYHMIISDTFPAILLLVIVALRNIFLNNHLFRNFTNEYSELPNINSLKFDGANDLALIVMNINNYTEIKSTLCSNIDSKIFTEMHRRIKNFIGNSKIYHYDNNLIWNSDCISLNELTDHLKGMQKISSAPLEISGQMIDVSISFGVDASFNQPIDTRIACALYCAEEAGRSGEVVKVYDPGRRDQTRWELSLLGRLEQAIDEGGVWVAYQPKIDIDTGQWVGAEALVRWTDGDRGMIAPDQFIPLAERHNRIDRLTFHVLEDAIATAASINASGTEFSVAVNLSTRMFQIPDLVDRIEHLLFAHGLPHDRLTLEITETGTLASSDPDVKVMRALAVAGIHLSIDDYGTGNATLDYLRIIPCDEVKIDRKFIAALHGSVDDRILVQSTIDMAHQLGRKVVAEGVERSETLALLRTMRCDRAQGYLIGKPMPRGALEAGLADLKWDKLTG